MNYQHMFRDPKQFLKGFGMIILVVIGIALIFSIISALFGVFRSSKTSSVSQGSMPMFGYAMNDSYAESAYDEDMMKLSVRNTISEPGYNDSVGPDAEAFEVTEYGATIKTRNVEKACGAIFDLKQKDYVIFERSNHYTRGCDYRFKVAKDNVPEILAFVQKLDPEDLNENSYTIQRVVNDYTNEIEVLQKKLASIEDTLTNATNAYDELTIIATRAQDVESLTKIIDSKIKIIERLTEEKIYVNERLDRIERSKAEQLDRLNYTYFSINVYEDKFVDGTSIKDSWELSIKKFVRNINTIAQDITINLVAFLFYIVQYVIYAIIIFFLAKYLWHYGKHLWRK